MRLIHILFAIALLPASAPAMADRGERGEWEIGPYVGLGFLDDYRTLSPDDDLLYGVRVGYFFSPIWSLEGSYQRLSTETQFNPLLGQANRDVDIDSLRANLLYNFRPRDAFRPFLTAGLGLESTEVDSILDSDDAGINLGGGARWFLGEHFGIRVDGRFVFTDVGGAVDDSQGNLEATFGVLWMLGGKRAADGDGDGVPDTIDECPSTRRAAAVDSRGCPQDSDGDGVPDGIDRCLDTPPTVAVDSRGCPLDSDSDGVNDALDRCPSTPRGALVDPQGCPRDSDQDGVFDGVDRCPDTPQGAMTNSLGCPADGDQDGVLDGLDRCPNTPRGAEVDLRGCEIPSREEPIVPEKRPLVLEGVNFRTDQAALTSSSLLVLDQVADSLNDWPEIRVEIGGHTDSTGNSEHNLRLSTARAEAVRDYLISQGVEASRLIVRGYGENRPVADNSTAAGRTKNRRVELIRID